MGYSFADDPMRSISDTVLSQAELESEYVEQNKQKRYFSFRRREKMNFKFKMCLFSILLGVAIFAFLLSFFNGTDLGVKLLDTTNSWMMFLINSFCDLTSSLTGWDGRVTLSRLLTFGFVSYIVFASLISFVLTGVIASVYSYNATWHALDDNTNNFVSEKRFKKR